MYLKNINLTNFRNYENLYLELSNTINIIYGQNAQGKTNLLESIYVLALTETFRSASLINLVKKNQLGFKIKGNLYRNSILKELEVMYFNNKKTLYQDLNKISRVSEYIKSMKLIIFSPDDLFLLKENPLKRRKYFDIQISQLNNSYYKILSEYNNILKIRNNILKKDYIDDKYLSIITKSLIQRMVIIYKNRYKYIEYLNNYINKVFNGLSGINGLSISYKSKIPNLDNTLDYINYLDNLFKKNIDLEKSIKKTIIGPHMDDYEFYLNDNNIINFASQGQKRMVLLALKLSEIELFKEKIGEYPILLLDDVFSELDSDKKNNLLKYIGNNIQTIITTTDIKSFNDSILSKSKLIEISNGRITGDTNGK